METARKYLCFYFDIRLLWLNNALNSEVLLRTANEELVANYLNAFSRFIKSIDFQKFI